LSRYWNNMNDMNYKHHDEMPFELHGESQPPPLKGVAWGVTLKGLNYFFHNTS
jgi:hypothetical protein